MVQQRHPTMASRCCSLVCSGGCELHNGSDGQLLHSQAGGRSWEKQLRDPGLRAGDGGGDTFIFKYKYQQPDGPLEDVTLFELHTQSGPSFMPLLLFFLFPQTPCILIIREMTSFGCDYRNFQLARVIGCM